MAKDKNKKEKNKQSEENSHLKMQHRDPQKLYLRFLKVTKEYVKQKKTIHVPILYASTPVTQDKISEIIENLDNKNYFLEGKHLLTSLPVESKKKFQNIFFRPKKELIAKNENTPLIPTTNPTTPTNPIQVLSQGIYEIMAEQYIKFLNGEISNDKCLLLMVKAMALFSNKLFERKRKHTSSSTILNDLVMELFCVDLVVEALFTIDVDGSKKARECINKFEKEVLAAEENNNNNNNNRVSLTVTIATTTTTIDPTESDNPESGPKH